jgi:hypothetical protein
MMCMVLRMEQAHSWRWPLPDAIKMSSMIEEFSTGRGMEKLKCRRKYEMAVSRICSVNAKSPSLLKSSPCCSTSRRACSSFTQLRRCQSMTEPPRRMSRMASTSCRSNSSRLFKRLARDGAKECDCSSGSAGGGPEWRDGGELGRVVKGVRA